MLDCVVIGAGQSGLYAAKCLSNMGLSYVTLEAESIGSSWMRRPHNMRLFTPRRFCMLPGQIFEGDPDGYPLATEMGNYLRSYAQQFQLSIMEGCSVTRLERDADGLFIIRAGSDQILKARSVINATGSNQQPIIPEYAENLGPSITQFTAELPDPGKVPDGQVLVVGGGASGRQIADQLSQRCQVTLARGEPRPMPPNRILGKDLFWWLTKLGLLFADKRTPVAKILRRRNPVPCANLKDHKLKRKGVRLVGKLTDCTEGEANFACGQSMRPDSVIWAMGYRDRTDWMAIPEALIEGEFAEDYGISPVPGLFVIGRKWLSCRASELVMGVERDASLVMGPLRRHLASGA
ncbi:flavin-containing monooxygenase [Marinimicrobium locisalis]|uniref:flavin-containing monooxygenase n=1 Tax=Marinimicrobium locisalis TaxID=546022 RepID=UPI003221C901